MQRIKNVISTCCSKDIATYKYASRCIVDNVDSDNYFVIVPEAEVSFFEDRSHPKVKVISENNLKEGFDLTYVRERMPVSNRRRAGWYFQQILKILALLSLPAEEDDILLIWDSDTIPLRKLSFVDTHGRLMYVMSDDNHHSPDKSDEYRSLYFINIARSLGLLRRVRLDECHSPYFMTIDRLLGLERKVKFSFISQCFPIRKKWLSGLIKAIETRNNCHWIDAILNKSDLTETSGFSEYETMGTYLSHHFPSEIVYRKLPWLKRGFTTYYKIENVLNGDVKRKFAYVAFETSDCIG